MNTATLSHRFSSLPQIQEQHAVLVKEVGGTVLDRAGTEHIHQFVMRCVASGEVLGASADRAVVQSLIAFWVGRLDHARQELELDESDRSLQFDDVLLEPFDQDAFNALVIAPTEEWLEGLSPSDRLLAQRIVIRLLNLRADGVFEAIPNTRTILEGLEPHERADEILNELVRRGVVRRVLLSQEFEGFSLQPLEQLKSWASLQRWMEERKRFREEAAASAQLPAEQPSAVREFSTRLLRPIYDGVLRLGSGMQALLRMTPPTMLAYRGQPLVSPAQFEEAENYRDKNADEVRFIYQKRQLDRLKLAAAQERLVGITLSSIALAILAAWAIRQSYNATEQRKLAEYTARSCEVRFANQQFNQSSRRLVEDPSGAMLFAAQALEQFDKSQTENSEVLVEPSDGMVKLRRSYLLTLGAAQQSLPMQTGMAFRPEDLPQLAAQPATAGSEPQKPIKIRAISAAGDTCLMASLLPAEKTSRDAAGNPSASRKLVFRLGQLASDGSWQLGKERSLPVSAESIESSSSISAYVTSSQQLVVAIPSLARKDIRLFYLGGSNQEPGSAQLGSVDNLIDAKFSSDGRYFGIVAESTRPSLSRETPTADKTSMKSSTLVVYRTEGWAESIHEQLAGEAGALAFTASPPQASGENATAPTKVAVALHSSEDAELLCQEWELDGQGAAGSPKRVTCNSAVMPGIDSYERVVFATYAPSRPDLLFVSDNGRCDALAWLVQTGKAFADPLPNVVAGADNVPVVCAAFSPNGQYLAVGRRDGRLGLWAMSGDETVEAKAIDLAGFTGHSEQVFALAFSPDSKYLVTGGRDRKALVLDLETRMLAAPPLWHSETVLSVGFAPDARHVTTFVGDTAVYTWQLPHAAAQILPIKLQEGWTARSRLTSKHGEIFVAGGERESNGGWIAAWETSHGNALFTQPQLDSPVIRVAVHEMPRLICGVTEKGEQHVFDKDGKTLWKNPADRDLPIFVAFGNHAKGARLLVIARDGAVANGKAVVMRVFHFDSRTATFDSQPLYEARFAHALSKGRFAESGDRFVAYSDEGYALVGEIAEGTNYQELVSPGSAGGGLGPRAHEEAITHAEFSDDGLRLVTASQHDDAIVWTKEGQHWGRHLLDAVEHAERGNEIGKHTANVNYASFDSSGDRVVTASSDGRGIVWRRVGMNSYYAPYISIKADSSGRAMNKAMFVDTRYILGAWDDGTVRIWDTLELSIAATGQTEKTTDKTPAEKSWHLHGREVASFKPPFMAKGFNCRNSADNAFDVTLVGRTVEAQTSPAGQAPSDASQRISEFKIAHWTLKPLSADVMDRALIEQMNEVACMLSARQITDDPLQLEPLPLSDVLQMWQAGVRPRSVLIRGEQGLSSLGLTRSLQ